MGRNRKNGSATRFVPAVKAALLCLLLGGSAIGYVYQKNQLAEIGKQIDKREKDYVNQRNSNAQTERSLAFSKTQSAIEERMRKWNLNLIAPDLSQILTIVEVPAPTATKSQPLYVERPDNGIAALK
jgi:hypothetical protein